MSDDKVFVLFEGHFSIHQARELMATVFGEELSEPVPPQGSRNLLLYFETKDLDGTFARIRDKVNLIHPIKQQHWGQRVFRFFDPDGHIVEIGEPMERYASWVGHTRRFYADNGGLDAGK